MLYAGKTHSKWKSLLHRSSKVSNVVMCPSEACALPAQLCSPSHKHINRYHHVIQQLSVHMTSLPPAEQKGQWGSCIQGMYQRTVTEASPLLPSSSGTCKVLSGSFIRSAVTPVNKSQTLLQRLKNWCPSSLWATSTCNIS